MPKWTKKENRTLNELYFESEKFKLLSLLPNRTWNGIRKQSQRLGLKRNLFSRNVTNKTIRPSLHVLLQENPLAYYWMGFIMADGNFNHGTLRVRLSIKDKQHLLKLCSFISSKHYEYRLGSLKYIGTNKNDILNIKKIFSKFDIQKNKTMNPPNVRIKENDLFSSFFAGFIDGDGSVQYQTGRKDCILTIKCHSSWRKNLGEWMQRIYELAGQTPKGKCGIDSYGYARIDCGNRQVLLFLKNKAVALGLPILSRKWDKI